MTANSHLTVGTTAHRSHLSHFAQRVGHPSHRPPPPPPRATVRNASSLPPFLFVIKGERASSTHWLQAILVGTWGAAVVNDGDKVSACQSCQRAAEYQRVDTQCGSTSRSCNCHTACLTCPLGAHEPPKALGCCWKHGLASDGCTYRAKTRPIHVCVARSPYAWLVSMHKHHYELQPQAAGLHMESLPFGTFLRTPVTDGHESYRKTVRDYQRAEFASPVDVWASRLRSYLELSGPKLLLPRAKLYEGAASLDAALRPLAALGVPMRPVVWPAFTSHDCKFSKAFTEDGFRAPASAPTRLSPPVPPPPLCPRPTCVRAPLATGRAAREDDEASWAPSFSQADLDYVNARLGDEELGAFGMRKVLTSNSTGGRRSGGGGGAFGGAVDLALSLTQHMNEGVGCAARLHAVTCAGCVHTAVQYRAWSMPRCAPPTLRGDESARDSRRTHGTRGRAENVRRNGVRSHVPVLL